MNRMKRYVLVSLLYLIGIPVVFGALPKIPAEGMDFHVAISVLEDQDAASKAYKQAYNHILDEAWDSALSAMEGFLKTYPKSQYSDDAAFWKIYASEKSGHDFEAVCGAIMLYD